MRYVVILLGYAILGYAVLVPKQTFAQSGSFTKLKSQLLKSLPDTGRIHLLLQIGSVYGDSYQQIRKKNPSKAQENVFFLDSALTYTNRAIILSRRLKNSKLLIESLLAEGRYWLTHIVRAKRERAIPYLQEAFILSSASNNQRLIAESLQLLGTAFIYKTDNGPNKAILFYKKALAVYERMGARQEEFDILNKIADVYRLFINPEKALPFLLKIHRLQKISNDSKVYKTTFSISATYFDLGYFSQAIRYGLLCQRQVETANDSSFYVDISYLIAHCYRELGDFERALSYYNKGLRLDSSAGVVARMISIIRTKGTIRDIYLQQNKQEQAHQVASEIVRLANINSNASALVIKQNLAMSYLVLNDFKKAEYWFLSILPMYEKPPVNLRGLCAVYSRMAELYIKKMQFKKSRYYLTQALALAEEANAPFFAGNIHLMLFKVDSTLGKLHSAIRHYQLATVIKDSLFTKTKNRQIEELQIQYEIEQKEKDIRLKEKSIKTLTQQRQLQDQKSKQEWLIRNVLISGAILLLLLLTVVYNRYHLKQRSNQLLQAQQEVINQKNATLQILLIEKEWLLKEIHHRVKNNLQVVMSLLNSQAAYLSDDAALSAIQESQHRVQAMALIHQKLYQSEGIARITMPTYIQEMVAYLRDAYDLPQPITFQLAIDSIELDVTQAVPLGLIINEAITNALKYAFPNGRSGTITLAFHRFLQNSLELKLEDDGVGLSPDYDPSRSRSLGMTLIQGFSQQLGGELTIRNNVGLSIRLVFSDEQLTLSTRSHHFAYQS
ncbi:tetratricopeptide repeat-containing sensor histidine kinase [Spirosoma spitsbergense]|uniref:tetratricopeptide repeat-containing sensor histidine kinase n=1 Tax=Spirosoma spitsbergense TaxID=431554 RepID=UPI00037E32FF|nr:histidine kinase dimerization/phosphoacceptor domain -containing protein [Spirosoma spitsbergense]